MDTDTRPSRFWACIAVIVGFILLLSGGATALTFVGVPFVTAEQDVFSWQLGQMAAMFWGLVCGPLALVHGAGSLFHRPSRPLCLPSVYFFWIVFALVLGLGNLLLNWHVSEHFLFPLLFLLGAALPTLSVVAWSVRRLGWPITWRQGALALASGSTLAVFLALVLETMLGIIEYFLLPPLRLQSGIPSDVVTRLFFSPVLIFLLMTTALQAPIPEEFSKGLSAILFGRNRVGGAGRPLLPSHHRTCGSRIRRFGTRQGTDGASAL